MKRCKKNIERLRGGINRAYGEGNIHSYGLKLDLGRLYAREMGNYEGAYQMFSGKAYEGIQKQLALTHEDLVYYNQVFSDIFIGLERFYDTKKVLSPKVDYLTEYYDKDKTEALPKLSVHFAKVLIKTGDYKLAGFYLEQAHDLYDQILLLYMLKQEG